MAINLQKSPIDMQSALNKIIAEPFQADFKPEDTTQMRGYLKALGELQNYLRTMTENKPEKRMIDAARLSEGIAAASGKIARLLSEPVTVSDIPKELFTSSNAQ